MNYRIVLEGGDGVGKTTISKVLGAIGGLTFYDRNHTGISKYMMLDNEESYIIGNIEEELARYDDVLTVILYSSEDCVIEERMAVRATEGTLGKYDAEAVEYNRLYAKIFSCINHENLLMVDICGKSPFEITREIIEFYTQLEIKAGNFDLANPTVEGESKKIYQLDNHTNTGGHIALVELKPSLYSFTHNRYDTDVTGTDIRRVNFWEMFGSFANNIVSRFVVDDFVSFIMKQPTATQKGYNKILPDLMKWKVGNGFGYRTPFISNFLGTIKIEDKKYVIIHYFYKIPPLEIVWKAYLVGTMKHTLHTVDQHKTKHGEPEIQYEGKFPNDFIRFDWRNPLPGKDECIPDDFAAFYIDVPKAKVTGMLMSHIMNEVVLKPRGYEFVDTCYFMDYTGGMVCSEITPDGMRIRNTSGDSFDKDLWRAGKDKETILKVWDKLYEDLLD